MAIAPSTKLIYATQSEASIAGYDVSEAVAAAMVTNAQSRTLAGRATDRINLADYAGSDPTGQTTNTPVINQALLDARAAGKALYVPAGVWGYDQPVIVQEGDVIVGDGPQSQFLYIGPTNRRGNSQIFSAPITGPVAPPSAGKSTLFANFRVTGPWNGTSVTTEIAQPLIQVQGFWGVEFRGLVGEYSSYMGFVASYCWSVRFIDCRMEHCARDALNASGSGFIQAILNQIHHCDDNAISAHSSTAQSWSMVNNVEIALNTITDTPGISVQGARRTIITNNVIERPRQIGIEVALVGGSMQLGQTAPLAVRITGNIVTDVINRHTIDGLAQGAVYIGIGSLPQQAGTAPAVPGTNLATLAKGPAVDEAQSPSRTWLATTIFVVGAVIVDALGNVQQSITPPTWSADAAAVAGQLILDAKGNLQSCTTAGTTGSTAPLWQSNVGATTSDGGAVWTCQAVGLYAPSSGSSAPAWASVYDRFSYDGTVCWQNLGPNAQYSVTPPYTYFGTMRASGTDTTTPIAPALSIEIASNHCLRTIDPTANWNYTVLGFGSMFTRNGWLDPKLGTNELAQGMGVLAYSFQNKTVLMRSVRITNNVFHGMQFGVVIEPGVVLQGGEIGSNNFVDFSSLGIQVMSPATPYTRLKISDNEFDGDPYTLYRGNASGGTWAAKQGKPAAIRFGNAGAGVIYERNRHRNLYTVLAEAAFPAGWLERDNVVACKPAAVGYSKNNAGVGIIPAAGPAFTHIIEEASPADVSMGEIVNAPLVAASAMPTSGTYVEGHLVRNTTPSTSNGHVLFGWLRLTTGSSNVAGTDWTPLFANTV